MSFNPLKKYLADPLAELIGIASNLPDPISDGRMRKMGYRPHRDEGDVERLAAAAEKRERRGARNRRNADRMAEGRSRRGIAA